MTAHVLPEGMPSPDPSPNSVDAPFWEGTRRGELMVQRCAQCGTIRAPEWICYRCYSFDIEWKRVPPNGVIYAWERVWHAAMPVLSTAVPYLVVVVELDDTQGLRLIGNLVGDPMQTLSIGDRVRAEFEHHEDYTLVQWRLG